MSLSQREHISGRQGTVPYKKIYLICPIDVFCSRDFSFVVCLMLIASVIENKLHKTLLKK